MIRHIVILFFFLGLTAYGQTKKEIKETLKRIDSKEKIEAYLLANPDWKIEYIELSDIDADVPKKLTKLEEGESTFIKSKGEKFHYKLLSKTKEVEFRVSYIYLNGRELTKNQIDSLRPLIIQKYKAKIPFEELVVKYNMDGNSVKGGDFGWFKTGSTVPEFEKAVQEHRKGDIFIVDVDVKNWYYVVLKTYSDREPTILKLVRVKEE